MLNTWVKPNDIIERKHWSILVSLPLTGKCVKNNFKTSAIHDHMLFYKIVVSLEDFSILTKNLYNFKLEIQESILIKLLKQTLNKNISSVTLYLFWDSVTIHYSEKRRSNLIIFWFISLIRSIEMLCKRIGLFCVKVYWTLQM